jgi:reductive dehalogenase
MDIGLVFIGFILFFGFGAFGLRSIQEKEARASKISFSLALLSSIPFFVLTLLPQPIKLAILTILGILTLALILLTLLPIGNVDYGADIPKSRFDERDVVFSRYYLRPGTQEYRSYYAERPENETRDKRMRERPGLYSPHAQIVNPTLLASPKASFFFADSLYPAVDGQVSEEKIELSTGQMTSYIKNLAKYYGAMDVGITTLKPYHVYSRNGRGSGTYGEVINLSHSFAIALTVEMDHRMIRSTLPASMETAKQYVEMARAAVQLAAAIRHMGYSARAHFEGDYQVIAPLIARDAGLGEFGRMSILITPHSGPRVRIAVVTTDLMLDPDQRRMDTSILDFCNICKKCAENCPSRAIPFQDRQETDGALRWKINAEACYSYWNTTGVDCARCVAVCPYSHPNHFGHNLVRLGISKSGFLRRAAINLDNLFYGRKPPYGNGPNWTRVLS